MDAPTPPRYGRWVLASAALVGLGKIGLPLAAQFAGRGQRVIGCDINPAVVEAINAGDCPIVGTRPTVCPGVSARRAARYSAMVVNVCITVNSEQ